jgi:hypothetical protein
LGNGRKLPPAHEAQDPRGRLGPPTPLRHPARDAAGPG